jgi:hypothetical protein
MGAAVIRHRVGAGDVVRVKPRFNTEDGTEFTEKKGSLLGHPRERPRNRLAENP